VIDTRVGEFVLLKLRVDNVTFFKHRAAKIAL
jgi:hypothetical protein